MTRTKQICTLNISAGGVSPAKCPTRERLAQAVVRLRNIELARIHRGAPDFGRSAEQRIIWRELLELELQFVDEQIERLSVP